jgi:hypothetical protein
MEDEHFDPDDAVDLVHRHDPVDVESNGRPRRHVGFP